LLILVIFRSVCAIAVFGLVLVVDPVAILDLGAGEVTIGSLLTGGTGWLITGITGSDLSSLPVNGFNGNDCHDWALKTSSLAVGDGKALAPTAAIGATIAFSASTVRQVQRC
jgi:hypothetical protein